MSPEREPHSKPHRTLSATLTLDMSTTGETIGFGQDIKPLFRERDRDSMSSKFDLWSYDDVARWSDAILARLRDGSMPCDGAWSEEQVARFEEWVAAGKPA